MSLKFNAISAKRAAARGCAGFFVLLSAALLALCMNASAHAEEAGGPEELMDEAISAGPEAEADIIPKTVLDARAVAALQWNTQHTVKLSGSASVSCAFQTTQVGRVKFAIHLPESNHKVQYLITDGTGTKIVRSFLAGSGTLAFDLNKGSYQLVMSSTVGSFDVVLTPSFSGMTESFAETQNGSNNTFSTASPIQIGKTYKGVLTADDLEDYYRFTLTKETDVVFSSNYEMHPYFYLYDSAQQKISVNFLGQQGTLSRKVALKPGTYYFVVGSLLGISTTFGQYELALLDASSQSASQSAASSRTMYRLYNPNSGEHFYTASSAEKDNLVSVGWNYEGTAWNAPGSGDPVYRMYNPNVGDHHYTTSAAERDQLKSVGWNYEGVGWYSDSSKKTPLYRLYNPNAVTGSHHYTTSAAERDHLKSVGWNDEGIGWYGK